jgi:hypothetical protein
MLRRCSDARGQCDPWPTALQRWGVQKTIPFQAFDFINVRLDDYRVTFGEVDAIRSEFDITDKITLVEYYSTKLSRRSVQWVGIHRLMGR